MHICSRFREKEGNWKVLKLVKHDVSWSPENLKKLPATGEKIWTSPIGAKPKNLDYVCGRHTVNVASRNFVVGSFTNFYTFCISTDVSRVPRVTNDPRLHAELELYFCASDIQRWARGCLVFDFFLLANLTRSSSRPSLYCYCLLAVFLKCSLSLSLCTVCHFIALFSVLSLRGHLGFSVFRF